MYEQMRNVGQRLGWKLDPADPGLMATHSVVTLFGMNGDVPVRLDRSSSDQYFATNAFVHPAIPFDFALTHEGLGATIKELLGFHDVEIGDPAFDKSFRVVTKDKEAIVKIITPEVKAALVALSAKTTHFRISGSVVTVTRTFFANLYSEADVTGDIAEAVAVASALKAAATAAGLYR